MASVDAEHVFSIAMLDVMREGMTPDKAIDKAFKRTEEIGHIYLAIAEDDGVLQVRLSPDEIAETYWYVANQHRSAWTWEVELRPWVERF